jgi:predicted ATPase
LLKNGSEFDPVEVEASFVRAIAVAREQGARLWELRAATSLARFWAERGELQKGRQLLVPIYGRVTEGLEMPDLQEPKALLDVVGAASA